MLEPAVEIVLDSKFLSETPAWSRDVVIFDHFTGSPAIEVAEFSLDGTLFRASDSILFECSYNASIAAYELVGWPPYESVYFVDTQRQRLEELLRDEILPFLWQEYVEEDEGKLAEDALELRADLLRRFTEAG